ncbi:MULTISPECIES: TetR/AcrR family transcriptional regulator [Exiguobacterium]|uniref:TetR family transcriptional regulator n=1 Tax=Exiguobacterium oxidotolerans TaxID=223958 RepID=A0A653IF08_9BACL|nr:MULTISPECIES: TetR/AcrR family transcriptional regulator [Exiguobacterium]ASI35001.1 TetR family transcriptional regulator [Exiguobacterium sp. N4-1P]VWX37848.1 TetR family transcriptional regulator [Exiguobacterium oxidotolerans]
MNPKKKQLLDAAYRLFVEKGYQSTSIQDILEHSNVSKGTFYNYFSSKNELFIDVFNVVFEKMRNVRKDILVGRDVSDYETFIQQGNCYLELMQKYKLYTLFEEAVASNEKELKAFMEKNRLLEIEWTYHRMRDLFGEEKAPYLLDFAVLYTGMLQYAMYFFRQSEKNTQPERVVRYVFNRLTHFVDDVSRTEEQLIPPRFLSVWLDRPQDEVVIRKELFVKTNEHMKRLIGLSAISDASREAHNEVLDFVYEELLERKKPKIHLLRRALDTLDEDPIFCGQDIMATYKEMVDEIVMIRTKSQ